MYATVLAVAGGGIYLVLSDKPPEPMKVTVAEARKATVTKTVRAVGHVEPVTMINVSSNITGDLLELHVKEGDRVKVGALMAEIDRERLVAVLRQNEANVRSLTASVELEQASLDRAQAESKRTEKLHGQGLATDAEIERIRSDVDITGARLEAAKQRVKQAQAALDEARDRVAKTRIHAPIDGTVISLKKKRGERIRGSELSEDILLTLAPLAAMQVEVEVSEQEVVSIVLGQAAKIEIDALEGSKIPGTVVEIANSADIKNRGTEMETTTFRVKVSLEQIPPKLRPGMTSSVEIITDVHEDVVAVPIEAVTARLPSQLEKKAEEEDKGVFGNAKVDLDEDNRTLRRREKPVEIVFVVENGEAVVKKVKTGIASDLDFEIEQGLEAGDDVIVGPYRALAEKLGPGSAVKIDQRINTTEETETDGPIAQEQ